MDVNNNDKNIPKGWKKVKLGEIVITNPDSMNGSYSFKEIIYLDTGSITKGKIEQLQKLKVKDAPTRAKRLIKDGDIIYSSVRPIQRHYGFIKNSPENLVVSTGFVVLRVKHEKSDSRFIYYFLTTDEIVETLNVIAEGSTSAYPSLRPSDIENLEILLPPLPEQKAIASVLSSLDDKIDLLHRQNQTLEKMAETLFRQWFIEEAKDDWEEGKLGDLIIISSGKGLKRKEFVNNGLYPVLGANGELGKTNNFLFDERLIFTGRVGTLGNVFISEGKVWLSDNTLIIRPLSQEFFYFVYFFLKLAKLEELNVGSTQPLIRQTDLKGLEIIVPDKETINRFHENVEQSFNKIRQNKQQIRTLEQLRDTLLPKLMSGEVRIKY